MEKKIFIEVPVNLSELDVAKEYFCIRGDGKQCMLWFRHSMNQWVAGHVKANEDKHLVYLKETTIEELNRMNEREEEN